MHQTFTCRDGRCKIQVPGPVMARARIDRRSIADLVDEKVLECGVSPAELALTNPAFTAEVDGFIISVKMFESDAQTTAFLGVWAEHHGKWWRVATFNKSWEPAYAAYNVACGTLPMLPWYMDSGIARAEMPNGSTINVSGHYERGSYLFTVGGQFHNCRIATVSDQRRDFMSLCERIRAHYNQLLQHPE